MKSRLAILSMLVGALLMSMTGAGLAISGISSNTHDVSVAQYGGGVAPEEQNHPSSGGQPKAANAAQPARQVEAGQTTNQLPFTGIAAPRCCSPASPFSPAASSSAAAPSPRTERERLPFQPSRWLTRTVHPPSRPASGDCTSLGSGRATPLRPPVTA